MKIDRVTCCLGSTVAIAQTSVHAVGRRLTSIVDDNDCNRLPDLRIADRTRRRPQDCWMVWEDGEPANLAGKRLHWRSG